MYVNHSYYPYKKKYWYLISKFYLNQIISDMNSTKSLLSVCPLGEHFAFQNSKIFPLPHLLCISNIETWSNGELIKFSNPRTIHINYRWALHLFLGSEFIHKNEKLSNIQTDISWVSCLEILELKSNWRLLLSTLNSCDQRPSKR